ncbi:MAG: hypothetical protein ACRDZ5_10905 [Acidimicrobiales bacterium]
MAIRNTAATDAARLPAAPARSPGKGPRADLDVVDRRHVRARAEQRRARLLIVLAALVVAGGLLLVAGGRAIVASDQIKLDGLQSQIGSALAVQQELQLERARLQSPERIETIAQRQLKMVTPSSVVYVAAVDPGETVAQAHKARGEKAGRPGAPVASGQNAGGRQHAGDTSALGHGSRRPASAKRNR